MEETETLPELSYQTIFEEEFLMKLPLFYRFMVITDTSSIGEMYNDVRFSKSKKHFAKEYVQYSPMYSYSNVFIQEDDLLL